MAGRRLRIPGVIFSCGAVVGCGGGASSNGANDSHEDTGFPTESEEAPF